MGRKSTDFGATVANSSSAMSGVAFNRVESLGAQENKRLGAQCLHPHAPLSTLHRMPHGSLRMTRGVAWSDFPPLPSGTFTPDPFTSSPGCSHSFLLSIETAG